MRKQLFVSLFVFGLSVIALYANIVVPFGPDSGGGVPAYARLETLPNGDVLVPNDGVWAAIIFYRDPECVPAEFNLLAFFDVPRAFGCGLTVEGFEVWRNGPLAGDLGPIQTVSHGLGAVPIWFVKLDELQSGVSDGALTVGELGSMSSLKKGSGIFFRETLHPIDVAQQTMIQIVARGVLEEGGSFFLQMADTHEQAKHVKIVFY